MRDQSGRWVPILGAAVVVAAILAAVFLIARTPSAILSGELLDRPDPAPESTETVAYTLARGKSAGEVGKELEALGIVRSSRQFELLVSLMGVQDRLQADIYKLRKGLAAATVIDRMVNREVVPVLRVTFPEGIRIEEMAQIAERAGFGSAQAFLAAAAAPEVPPGLAGVVPEGKGFHGFLFPDTYIMPVGSTAAELVSLMLKTFDERFSLELRRAAQAQKLTPHQAITLAAIVEREAVLEAERPIIASAFLNRLAKGIKLDADPTVQFALAETPANVERFGYWKKDLLTDDLKVVSPYNTYLNAGLPPGPIANPGLASIRAVANPATTAYQYFVADTIKNDGSHAFAETLDEHLANVARFQP